MYLYFDLCSYLIKLWIQPAVGRNERREAREYLYVDLSLFVYLYLHVYLYSLLHFTSIQVHVCSESNRPSAATSSLRREATQTYLYLPNVHS